MTDQLFIMETKWQWMLKKCAYVVISADVSHVIMHVNYAALPEDQTILLTAGKQTFKWQFYTLQHLLSPLIEWSPALNICSSNKLQLFKATWEKSKGMINTS